MKTLSLKKYEDRRLREGHLWIYSNEVDTAKTPLKTLTQSIGKVIEFWAHWAPKRIALRFDDRQWSYEALNAGQIVWLRPLARKVFVRVIPLPF